MKQIPQLRSTVLIVRVCMKIRGLLITCKEFLLLYFAESGVYDRIFKHIVVRGEKEKEKGTRRIVSECIHFFIARKQLKHITSR